MMRRKITSRPVQTLSPDSIRSDEIASTDIAWSRWDSRLGVDVSDIRCGLVTKSCRWEVTLWPPATIKSTGPCGDHGGNSNRRQHRKVLCWLFPALAHHLSLRETGKWRSNSGVRSN